jgi:hypothetical protein
MKYYLGKADQTEPLNFHQKTNKKKELNFYPKNVESFSSST